VVNLGLFFHGANDSLRSSVINEASNADFLLEKGSTLALGEASWSSLKLGAVDYSRVWAEAPALVEFYLEVPFTFDDTIFIDKKLSLAYLSVKTCLDFPA